MTDTFFADVSEFQCGVDDSYPHPVLSIRSNDGTYRDHNFAHNYAWMRAALDSGKLTAGIVYAYVRPNWVDTANTLRDMVNSNGGLHPKVVLMLDVESGGNPGGDQSDWINRTYWNLVDFAGGDALRVIGYANSGDFFSMWPQRPDGLRVIGAGYGENPELPGQIAHQFTDGVYGAGQGLPMGAPPFGRCDMNVADGLDPEQFAAACGIGDTGGIVGQTEVQQVNQFTADYVKGFCQNIYLTAAAALKEQTGSPIVGQFPGFAELGGRTQVQAAQALGWLLQRLAGVDAGFQDPATNHPAHPIPAAPVATQAGAAQ